MSQDPVRMLSGNGASGDERALLRAGLDVDPPPGAKEEVWATLAPQLPPSGGPGDSTLHVARSEIWKTVAIGFAMGLAGVGGAELASNYSNPRQVAATVAADNRPVIGTAESLELTPPAPAVRQFKPDVPLKPSGGTRRVSPLHTTPELELGSAVGSFPPPESADPVAKRKSQLKDESRMLREARAALQSGNAPRALTILNEAQKQYPGLILAQEHEALSIDALLASGGTSAAESRARRFLQNYPNSPHAEKMKSIAKSP